jgi:hypothetical protein
MPVFYVSGENDDRVEAEIRSTLASLKFWFLMERAPASDGDDFVLVGTSAEQRSHSNILDGVTAMLYHRDPQSCCLVNVGQHGHWFCENLARTLPASRKVLVLDFDMHSARSGLPSAAPRENVVTIAFHQGDHFRRATSSQAFGTKNRINVPWRHERPNDSDFYLAFVDIVVPVLRQFAPDLVLVSVGENFTKHTAVSPVGHAHLLSLVRSECPKTAVAVGPSLNASSTGVQLARFADWMLGYPDDDDLYRFRGSSILKTNLHQSPHPKAAALLHELQQHVDVHWPGLHTKLCESLD